jgi:hypothetical protein
MLPQLATEKPHNFATLPYEEPPHGIPFLHLPGRAWISGGTLAARGLGDGAHPERKAQ